MQTNMNCHWLMRIGHCLMQLLKMALETIFIWGSFRSVIFTFYYEGL